MATDATEQVTELKTKQEKISYALGMDLGSYLKSLEADFELAAIYQGVIDSYTEKKALLTSDQAKELQKQFAVEQQKKKMKKISTLLEKNKKAATQFLEKNKEADGVKVTASGLQYKVIKEGEGKKPLATDTVKVHYKGTLVDGTEFDSSYKRNEPATFKANQVIPGWTEALQLMTPGSKYILYLPPELAYGDRGAPPAIEPGSLLIFEVELVDIVKGNK
ncbi:MAG: FKBP-type peptidyl-prolyl cis-trans isomerase [Candidatus Electrothrix sp. AW5]|nr:FKBP-type peptidyl-prolyl cis-trans isomerase [Candidatus Electrothrix sp. AX1]MCI5181391.1 FKBP-type peptidyl-prolyl cis-trans isomerase [Candidatus Electrothrix gigas]MCI5196651.1 FKBP-type peptidyl-prolyl cis-trans isomerase [Candidatus Electrothrix gigas]